MVGRFTPAFAEATAGKPCAPLSQYVDRHAGTRRPPQMGRTLRCSYENRTSFPGSISKSSASESSVFGLITSSMNFT